MSVVATKADPDEDMSRRDKLVESEKKIKDARRREKALQNDLAIVRSQLAVKEEKLRASVREIAAAKAAHRESSAMRVNQLAQLHDDVSRLAQRLINRDCEFEADMASARAALGEAARDMRLVADDALVAATCAFDAKHRENEAVKTLLTTAGEAQETATRALTQAREEKNTLVTKSNSLQRTLESLKHDLARMSRELEKQRIATQQLRMSLTEAIDDRDKAIAAKEEWREVASFPGIIDKLDKASVKENELRRIISKLTFSLQEKDIQLDAQRATAKALQRELSSSKRI